jgi:hypothetical protein
VTCQQLKSLLESCASPEQALRLLLRNSRSHPVTLAKEAAAKQGRQGQAAAGEASDGETSASLQYEHIVRRNPLWGGAKGSFFFFACGCFPAKRPLAL